MSLKTFKKNIGDALMEPFLRQRQKEKARNAARRQQLAARQASTGTRPLVSAIGSLTDGCFLAETSTAGAYCFLCNRLGKLEGKVVELKVQTGCPKCKKCFHPNCFVAYHYRGVLGEAGNAELAQRLARLDLGIDIHGNKVKKSNLPVRGLPSLAELQIPFTPKVKSRNRRTRAEMEAARGATANDGGDDHEDGGDGPSRRQRTA